ncbi:type II secretion system protein [Sulfurimonas sp.]
MKRSGFTLIELIFVIVIIGVLAAVAVPKFKNLKQSAEANSVVSNVVNGAQSAVNAAVNMRDLEHNTSYTLEDIVSLNGRGWVYDSGTGPDGNYTYKDGANTVGSVALDATNGKVFYSIDCGQFADAKTQTKCENDINQTTPLSVTIDF